MRVILTALFLSLLAAPASATKKLPPHVIKQLLIRRALNNTAKATTARTRAGLKKSTQSTRRRVKVKVKVVKHRTSTVPVQVHLGSKTPKRAKVVPMRDQSHVTAVRVYRRDNTSSIDLLKAALDGNSAPKQRQVPRIHVIPQPSKVVIVPRRNDPPSTLTQLKYQMDLLQMSEAL